MNTVEKVLRSLHLSGSCVISMQGMLCKFYPTLQSAVWPPCEIYVFDIVRQVDSRQVPEEADRQKHQDDWRLRPGANLR